MKTPVLNYFETAPSHTVEISKGGAPKLQNLTSRPGRTVEHLKDGASILEIFDKSPSQTVGYLRVRTPRLGKNPTCRLLPAAVEEFAAPALREAQQRKGNVARMYAMVKHTIKFFCLFEIMPHRLGAQPLCDCFVHSGQTAISLQCS